MVCKKLNCYNDLKVMLDNYGQYIDFQYRVVSNIWSSVEIEDKLFHALIYENFLYNLKEIGKEYYKAQKSFYKSPIPISRSLCRDECTCKRLSDLNFAVEREIFFRVSNKLHKINNKIHDFNLLCGDLISSIFRENMNRFRHKLNNGELHR